MGRTTHLIALDWLRGLAAMLVFAMHVELSAGGTRVFAHGYLAVDLFFVLSGFVIARAYEGQMRRPGGRGRFAVRRFIRLYPLAVLGSIIGILTWLIGQFQTHHLLLVLACQMLLVPQLWQGATLFLLNSVHWSLMLEVLANLGHALGIRRLTTRAVGGIALLGWIALVASAWHWGNLSVGYARTNAWGGVARALFGYASGVLLFRLHAGGRLPRWRAPAPAVAALPLVLLVPGLPALAGLWFADVVVVTIIPAMLIVALASELPARLHGAALALGQLSYPLYAIHLPLVMTGVGAIMLSGATGAVRIVAMTGVVGVVIGFALLAGTYYDAPLRRRLTQGLAARPASIATVSP